jgi:hypothetical protein
VSPSATTSGRTPSRAANGRHAYRQERRRPAGGNGPDRLEGDDGNDTLVGGPGEDRIFTSRGFDFVFAFDGDRDVVNCNGQSKYRIVFDENLDRLEQCPGANTDGKSGAAMFRGKGRRCRQSRKRGVGRFHRDWSGVLIWAPAHLFLEPSGGRIVVRLVSERRR